MAISWVFSWREPDSINWLSEGLLARSQWEVDDICKLWVSCYSPLW